MAAGLVAPAHAGPPFVTDDPEPVEYRAWEVNDALTSTRDASGTLAYLPQIDANYGPAPGVQLHVQPQLALVDTAGARSFGAGVTELGLKVRLTPEKDSRDSWMISVYPLYELPTQRPGLAALQDAGGAYLPVWFQTTRGNWQMYGGGGRWINSAAGSRDAWAGGWVVLHQLTEALQFGGEVFAKGADSLGGRPSSGFNLGGNYQLARDYALLFSAGRGLGDAYQTNRFSGYLGLQVIY